jgi:hypothetical protein
MPQTECSSAAYRIIVVPLVLVAAGIEVGVAKVPVALVAVGIIVVPLVRIAVVAAVVPVVLLDVGLAVVTRCPIACTTTVSCRARPGLCRAVVDPVEANAPPAASATPSRPAVAATPRLTDVFMFRPSVERPAFGPLP